MAKKVTISVPDDLYERMKEWRSTTNFSQVFQRSMSNMIRKKEELRQKIHDELDLSCVVERLRREKAEFEANFIEEGKQAGLEWSRTAHYRELQYALGWRPEKNPFKDEHLGDYFSQVLKKQSDRFTISGRTAQKRFQGFIDTYLSGWKEGVESFWNEVKDKM
ncbi:hypothetical protein [Desulfoluna sp.]|uniref:hypothetical protein n=1 Tax=Desulfoluna sp. TaxID=2045199 RepID=UPI0026354882|nr:hypothetical protein [Desulfoluna sp.]